MMFSVNNRVITEPYVKEGLKARVQGGIATPGQRDGLKGLKVLVSAKLSDGTIIPKGSTIYVREEALHTHPWASKPLSSDVLGSFLIVEATYVECYEIHEGALRT
jgi:hypothetical protein